MRYFLIFFLLLCFFVCKAQTGHYFLSHFSPGDERVDHMSFDMEQDANGILYFATRSGVLTYDGKNWELIPCNGPVYALELSQSGELYWAGADGFGQIIRDKYGRYISIVLSNPDNRDIYQALALGNKVYFMNDKGIFIFENQSERTINTHNVPGSFTSLFEMFGVAYVATDLGRIFKVDELKLGNPAFEFEEGLDITFSCGAKDKFILGTADNRLFLCTKDYSIEEIKLEESDYINASVIVNGVPVSNNLIALGTLRGGVIIVNIERQSIEEIVNYNTGLPDNEIFALLVDKDKNIWASHDYGFTKISPLSPFRSFSHYDNLNGNLLCALSVNNDVYVGTSLGLFKLIKEEVYDEIIYYEDVPIKRTTLPDKAKTNENVSPTDSEATTTAATEEPEKRKKGFLRFLKRNKTESEEKVVVKESPAKKNNEASLNFQTQLPKEEYAVQRLRKTQKVLRSSNFAYRKVKGIAAKVTHLAIANNKLLAAGLGGLFEIDNLSANAILEEPVRFLFTSGDTIILASTYRDRVLTLKKNGSRWRTESEESNPDDQISNIFQGPAGELWLCGMNTIYRLENNGNIFSSFEFTNPNFSRTIGLQWKNEIILVNTNGFFRLDANRNSIVRIDSMPTPRTYFTSNNELWYHDGNNWNTLSQFDKRKNIHLLNLCGDIRYISPDNYSENLWIINANNELYKFLGNDVSYTPGEFPLVLKTLSQSSKPIAFGKRIIINQDNGLVEIELARANFAGAVEYRYMLKGINEDWSDWSARNDRISFSYLPQGSYTLSVQSRDIFGTIKEAEPIQLLVKPPYWKTPWFYAMEFTVFALLVLLSFKLSVRYRFISRVLSLLTIILLIEFIQTMIGFSFATNSTPIIDFIIQVIVAFIILPVEGYLRNLMFKSMGANSRLFDVIAELDRSEKSRK